jgi:hypothetical protein
LNEILPSLDNSETSCIGDNAFGFLKTYLNDGKNALIKEDNINNIRKREEYGTKAFLMLQRTRLCTFYLI